MRSDQSDTEHCLHRVWDRLTNLCANHMNDVGCEINGEIFSPGLSHSDLAFLPIAHHVSRRGASECGGEEDEGGT